MIQIAEKNVLRFRLQSHTSGEDVYVRGMMVTAEGIQYPIAAKHNPTSQTGINTIRDIELPPGRLEWLSAGYKFGDYVSYQADLTYVSLELLSRASAPDVSGTPLIAGFIRDGQGLSWPHGAKETFRRPEPWYNYTQTLDWEIKTTPLFVDTHIAFEKVKTLQIRVSNPSAAAVNSSIDVSVGVGGTFQLLLGKVFYNLPAGQSQFLLCRCGANNPDVTQQSGARMEDLLEFGLPPGESLRFAGNADPADGAMVDNIVVAGIGLPIVRYAP